MGELDITLADVRRPVSLFSSALTSDRESVVVTSASRAASVISASVVG